MADRTPALGTLELRACYSALAWTPEKRTTAILGVFAECDR
jgi:hypothetical protein